MVRAFRNHQQIACAANREIRFRHHRGVPIESGDLLDETSLIPSAGLIDRILPLDECLRGVFGLHTGGVAGDEALVEPVVDGVHGIGENLGVPVDIALVELPVVDEFGVGLLGNQLPPQPHHAVFLRVGGDRRHSGIHEFLADVHELVIGGRNLQPVLGEQILVVVDALEFRVTGHAVPGVTIHDAVFIILGHGRIGAGHLLVPTVLIDVITQIGEQPHGGEHAGRTVAAIGFHKIRRLIGIEELAAVLRDLRERLAFEIDFDTRFLFEGFRGATPCLGLASVVFLVIPERQAVWRFLVLRGVAAACSERGQRHCRRGRKCDASCDLHGFSFVIGGYVVELCLKLFFSYED